MSVERFWCHEASNIRCVRESDYDALAQQLAAKQSALDLSIKSRSIETEQWMEIVAARDKRFAEAVGLLRGLCEYADGLHGDLFQAWAYAGSTASRTDHSDEDYLRAKAFLSQSDEAKQNEE